MSLMGLWWCSGLLFPVHAHQAAIVDFYSAPLGETSPYADVSSLHFVIDPRCLFVATPLFVLGGLGS